MKLLNKEIERRIPRITPDCSIYTTGTENDKVYTRFFNAPCNWDWYATHYDPEHQVFYGWVNAVEKEHGFFSLRELEAFQVERDLYWYPWKALPTIKKIKEEN